MTEEDREERVPESDVEVDATLEEGVSTGAVELPEEREALQEEIVHLTEKLAETEKQVAEYLDGWQRCQATFANFRKRTEAEQVTWRSAANAALLSRLLPVLDDFARAFQALPADLKGNSWLDGIALIQRKVATILETENVKPVDLEPGDTFDPLYHQAVFYQEVPGFEDGQIVAEVERGYLLGERVLRPASVVVAKAPPAPAPEPEVIDVSFEPEAEIAGDDCACEDESCHCDDTDVAA